VPDAANPRLNTLALGANISQLAVAMMQNQGAWLDIDLRALKIEDFNIIGRKGEMQGVALFEIDRIARGCHAVDRFEKLYPRWRSPFIWRKRPAVMLSISGDRIARGEADPEIDPLVLLPSVRIATVPSSASRLPTTSRCGTFARNARAPCS
jgi:hypothetical protein